MTKRETLLETIRIWKHLMHKPWLVKAEVPGALQYQHKCPLCSYANFVGLLDCSQCPLVDAWYDFNLKDYHVPVNMYCVCEQYLTSPWEMWKTNWFDSEYDVCFFAALIVEMAQEALKKLDNPQ